MLKILTFLDCAKYCAYFIFGFVQSIQTRLGTSLCSCSELSLPSRTIPSCLLLCQVQVPWFSLKFLSDTLPLLSPGSFLCWSSIFPPGHLLLPKRNCTLLDPPPSFWTPVRNYFLTQLKPKKTQKVWICSPTPSLF